MEIKRKSYYDIHGTIPTGNQALPADGMMFFPDIFIPENEREPKCTCDECEFQRKYKSELFQIYKKEQEIAIIKKKIAEENDITTTEEQRVDNIRSGVGVTRIWYERTWE